VNSQLPRSLLLLFEEIQAGEDQLSTSSETDKAVVCPASLRFKERSRPDATIVPACRARHGHQKAIYTSTDSWLTIGKYTVVKGVTHLNPLA